MNNIKAVIVRFLVIFITPILVCGNPAEEKLSESDKTEVSRQEHEIFEYLEKTKSEILDGRKFNDQSTPANALLTFISAFHHRDQNTLEQVFPFVKERRELSSPELGSKLIDWIGKSSVYRIHVENKSSQESDICGIFTTALPGEVIDDQVWIFGYVVGAWRFLSSTSDKDPAEWIPDAEKNEAITRNILQSEAEKNKTQSSDGDPTAVAEETPKPDKSAVNRVLNLDGQKDYVRIADSQSLRSFSDAITIEVLVKASSYAESGDIDSIIRKNIASGAENFLLRFRNIGGNLWVQMSLSGIGLVGAQHDFTAGNWYHLAGVYNGSTMTVLVNGQSMESKITSGSLYIDESDLFIGKGDPEFRTGEYFHGELDEIRIWNVARSPEEIRAAMNSPLTGKEEGLVAYLNFDDGTAKDQSGHGNDGLLDANARIVESPYPSSLAPGGEKAGKLLAWWKFDNDANDSAGGNHGTVNGNPTYADGKFGRSISLDGDDYVDCGNPDLLNFGAGDWTISAWIKTTQSGIEDTDKGTVFANGADGGGGIRYTIAVNEGQTNSIALTTDNDAHKAQAIGKTAVNDGAWHHIVGMRNAGQLRVYVDGVLDGGNYLPAGYDLSGTSQHNAYIGVITDNIDNSLFKHFIGLIDEVCIIGGAIDANGVRALYSGEDPATIAKTAIIEPQARPRPVSGTGAAGSIEGDWRIISNQISQQAIIEIRKKTDGTLAATVVADIPDETSPPPLLDKVAFENGKLRFEVTSEQTVFEGTMKEDGSAIEGSFQQQGQIIAVVLKRIVAVPSEMATVAQEQLQDRTSGTGNIATALILILALAGVVGGIVFFLVKSSIGR